MSNKKYIIILLTSVIITHCAPSKYYTYKNHTERKNYDSSDYDDGNDYAITEDNNAYLEDQSTDKSPDQYQLNSFDDNNKIKSRDSSGKYREDEKLIIENRKLNYKFYIVKKEDNLFKISKKFNVSLNQLIEFNNIKNNRIYEGSKIFIPPQEKNLKKQNPAISISRSNHPETKIKQNFNWPINKIISTSNDGSDGVKPIGIIITTKQKSPVFSAAEGTVTKIGSMRGFGNYIILKHAENYLTIYSYLECIEVNEGDKIPKGKIIARLEGNKLHFQISHSRKSINPLLYLTKKA